MLAAQKSIDRERAPPGIETQRSAEGGEKNERDIGDYCRRHT